MKYLRSSLLVSLLVLCNAHTAYSEGADTSSSLLTLRSNHHCKSLQRQTNLNGKRMHLKDSRVWMRYWDPTWTCPIDEKFGHHGAEGWRDGAKWVCNPQIIEENRCLVYSFGSLGEYDFENTISSRKHCEIHVFDPFNVGSPPKDQRITVHKVGIAEVSKDIHQRLRNGSLSNDVVIMKSLPDIVRMLGHEGRNIDILKIDVEGCEYGVLDNASMWQELKNLKVSFDQVLAEIHIAGVNRESFFWRGGVQYSGTDVDRLFRALTMEGYAMFHKEGNMDPRANNLCTEYGFVKLNIDCSNQDHISKSKYYM